MLQCRDEFVGILIIDYVVLCQFLVISIEKYDVGWIKEIEVFQYGVVVGIVGGYVDLQQQYLVEMFFYMCIGEGEVFYFFVGNVLVGIEIQYDWVVFVSCVFFQCCIQFGVGVDVYEVGCLCGG